MQTATINPPTEPVRLSNNEYYAWKNGCGFVEKEVRSSSLDHIIRVIMQDGDYARYDDFVRNSAEVWHLFIDAEEVELLELFSENNYQWLWDQI